MPQGPAPDANALTLLEWQKFANNPLYNAVVMSLYDSGSILTDIPWKIKKTMNMVGARYTGKNMPRVDFVKVNDLPIGTKTVPEKFTESAFIIRNDIIIDKYINGDENTFTDLAAFQIDAYLKSVTYKFNDYFINNYHDGALDHDDAPVGLKYRIGDSANTSPVYGVQGGLLMDAGGVDISLANISAANANNLLVQIDRMLSAMNAPDGKNVVIYANEVAMRLVASAIRNLPGGAGWATTTNNYDREVATYKKAVFRDIGRKDDQVTYVINPYETSTGADATGGIPTGASYGTAAGTGKNFTSLYFVKYGEMNFSGWQWDILKAQDFGMVTPPGTYRQILFDWACGFYMPNSRSIGRLYDIKMGV